MILALMAEGVDGSALERVFGYREGTQRTWLTRAGMQAGKVHRHFFCHLSLHHIQLDELWVNARQGSCFPDNIAGGHRPWQLGLPEPADCVRIAFFSTSLIGKMKIYLGKPVRVGDKKLTFAPF